MSPQKDNSLQLTQVKSPLILYNVMGTEITVHLSQLEIVCSLSNYLITTVKVQLFEYIWACSDERGHAHAHASAHTEFCALQHYRRHTLIFFFFLSWIYLVAGVFETPTGSTELTEQVLTNSTSNLEKSQYPSDTVRSTCPQHSVETSVTQHTLYYQKHLPTCLDSHISAIPILNP